MRKFFTTIALLLFCFSGFAQTPVPMGVQPGLSYTENFADIAAWTNAFASGIGANRFSSVAVNATGTIPDGVRITAATATFVTATSGGVQKGTAQTPSAQNIVLLATGATDNSSAIAIDFFMDFTGVNAGTLSFDWASVNNSTGDRKGSLRVYYSTNGTSFTELPAAQVLNITNNVLTSGSITTVTLPAAFNNSATARLRFYYVNATGGTTGSRPKISIDNLNVTALPAGNTVSAAAGTNAGEPATNGSFTINFNTPTTGSTDVNYAYTGAAGFGTDYSVSYSAGTPSTSTSTGTLTVPTGTSSVTVTITPIDDAVLEGNESVILGLSGPTGGYSVGTASATIQITDDEVIPTVSVAAGINGAEPATNGTFTLTLSSPAPAGGITIAYTLTGTATIASDYTDALSGSITIPQGSNTGTLTLTTVNNNTAEPTETIIVTLNTVTSPYIIATASASINITDEDVAPISYTGNYTQDFNTIATTGTGNQSTLPTGWTFSETGANTNATYTAGTGSANSGDTYSFGTGTAADRAFGGLRSGSLVPTVGAYFINNTGATVSSLTISYTGEQWRLGTTGRTDRLDFQYSLDATSTTTGTWTNADALDFVAPNTSGATGAQDGNAVANRTTITYVLTGISIANGSSFFFRWNDLDATGADDGLSIDDFSISAGCTPPTNQPTSLVLTPALTSIGGSFTASVPGTTAADAYLVIMSTSPTLTVQPSSGGVYAIDDAIGNGQVVSFGSSTTFNVTGLNPSTPYYFFVYANIAASNCYNITGALTGTVNTSTPPACTPPSTQVSGLSASNITGVSMDLNYTRGNGTNILIVANATGPVNSNPINSLNYPVSTQIGTGNFVIYNGTAATFNYAGLTANTTYYFALYEYNSADFCYNVNTLTGNFTTACVNPVNVSALNATSGNGNLFVTWTLPTATCFDEIIVVASNASVPGVGSDYTDPANATYAGPNQVVYRGTGSNVPVTGLTNGTTYYFRVFTRLGAVYSSGVQVTGTPFDPATGYTYLYGNIHAHSSYSDGNKDDLSKTPLDNFTFARDANCMDFLGMSEHNHAGAGMNINNYLLGYNQANSINGVVGGTGNSIVTLWGMEWGTISGGGHVLVYGFDDKLIGWEPGNYDIFAAKGDYTSLFTLINGQANAFATLAHPNTSDYNGIAGTYSASADNAIVGSAVESGPAFSTSVTYNDFPAQLSYLSYYKTMLAKGYRMGPVIDHDNHNFTFGRSTAARTVILATSKSRADLISAYRSMRFYASEDCNVKVEFKSGANVMGSSVVSAGVPTLTLAVTDLDNEAVDQIELWGGIPGGTEPVTPIKTYTAVSTFTFNSGDAENVQADNTTYYYYVIITQADGNKIVSAPIWYTRSGSGGPLPVTLIDFTAVYHTQKNAVVLNWSTAQEFNSELFVIERSNDRGRTFTSIGTVAASGTSSSLKKYTFTDFHPQTGTNLYRLKKVDIDQSFDYSKVVSVTIRGAEANYFSVYPNPVVEGVAYLYSTSTVTVKGIVQLTDITGKVLSTREQIFVGSTPVRYDLKNIKPGVYFVKFTAGDITSVQKIIVR